MNTGKQKVVFIIINFCSAQWTENLIQTLQFAYRREECIYIFDNGSGSHEFEKLKILEGQYNSVKVFKSETNLGYFGGFNKMLSQIDLSGDDYVCLLNPDVELSGSQAIEMISLMKEAKINVASPTILTGGEKNIIWFEGGHIDFLKGKVEHINFGQNFTPNKEVKVVSTQYVSGACLFFDSLALKELTPFPEEFFLYWEDALLSYSALNRNLSVAFVQGINVWHREGGSSGDNLGYSANFYYYVNRNRVLFYLSYSSRFQFFLFGFLTTIRYLLKPLIRERQFKILKTKSALYGLIDGLQGKTGQKQ
jgi:GT2 family glycosyltransferase